MKHKHAEILHAIADGVPVQFRNADIWRNYKVGTHSSPLDTPDWVEWRIKPAEVPQWRKDMAQALKDGKVVEVEIREWNSTTISIEEFLNPEFMLVQSSEKYRIRPEPDDVCYFVAGTFLGVGFRDKEDNHNLKLTFDANGNLKDAEVL
jgi:hypothetical protein